MENQNTEHKENEFDCQHNSKSPQITSNYQSKFLQIKNKQPSDLIYLETEQSNQMGILDEKNLNLNSKSYQNKNIFTPSNSKLIKDQFSNDSFGITPKKIDFSQHKEDKIEYQHQESEQKYKNNASNLQSPLQNNQNYEFQTPNNAIKGDFETGNKQLKSILKYENTSISSLNNSIFEDNVTNTQKNRQQDEKQELFGEDYETISAYLNINKFNRNQLILLDQIVKSEKNIFKIMLNQSGKNVFYQALSLIYKKQSKIIVVVSNNFKNNNINKQVSWCFLNNQMDQQLQFQAHNLINDLKIKLLFVSWDMIVSESVRFLKNIIQIMFFEDNFDKIQQVLEVFKPKKYNLFLTNQYKCKQEIENICQNFQIFNLNPEIQLFGYDFENIHWIFDIEKEKNLVSFVHKNQLQKVILYIDKRKKMEEICSFFAQKGLKIQAYCSQKSDQITNNFIKNQISVLCCFSGQILPKSIKEHCQIFIHYNMPQNILNYLSDLNGIQYYHMKDENTYQKIACGFLTEQDYFEIRRGLIQELIDKKHIKNVLKALEGDETKKKESQVYFHVVPSENERKIQEHYEKNDQLEVKQIQILKFCRENDIKKETLLKILNYIQDEKGIKVLPIQGQIKIIQKTALNNPIVAKIFKDSQQIFSFAEISEALQMNMSDVNKELKKLVLEKKIQYEVKEEIAIVGKNVWKKSNVFQDIQRIQSKDIQDLDFMYFSVKSVCNLTLEQVFKYNNYTSLNQNLYLNLEKYLNNLLSSSECQNLPFISLKSQREKSNLIKDIQNVLKNNHKYNEHDQNIDIQEESRFICLAFQGIHTKQLKTIQQLGKYFRYDYFEIEAITQEYLEGYILQLKQQKIKKRIKI